MACRILHVTAAYPACYPPLVAGIPENERTYARLLKAYVDSRVGWSDFWVRGMRRLGYEAEMVVCNFELLQKAWASERGWQAAPGRGWAEILVAQTRVWKPDVIFIQDLYTVSAPVRRALRDALPNMALLGWRFAPTPRPAELGDLDAVVTGAEVYAEEFRRVGIRTEVVPLFFPEDVLLDVVPPPERTRPFIFCGSIIRNAGWHAERYRAIRKLLDNTPLEIHAAESAFGAAAPRWAFLLKACPRIVKRALPDAVCRRMPLQQLYPRRFRAAVSGLDYFRLLAETEICFNAHGDLAAAFAGNMRLFEATGMGACLLTDHKPNLADFFEPDREVVAYRTPAEAVDKARYLLAHPRERADIAERGRLRTLRDHTLAARLPNFGSLIEQAVRARAASALRKVSARAEDRT